jgi:hypothetical protein
MTAGTNSNVGVPTSVGFTVTKNSDLTYNITSKDTSAAPGWVALVASADYVDAFSAQKNKLWGELLRQITQI